MEKGKFLAAIILTFITALAGVAQAETIFLRLEAGPYEIVKDRDGFDRPTMEGYRLRAVPGNPILPVKVFNILVPPDILWDSLELSVIQREGEILPGAYQIRPGAPDVTSVDGKLVYEWGEAKAIVEGKNVEIYGVDAFFPSVDVKLLPYSQLRKWKYTRLEFWPFQYNPITGELNLTEEVRMEISFSRSGEETSPTLLMDRAVDDLAPGLFFNYESGKRWYLAPSGAELPGQNYTYVIITSNAIASGSPVLSDFIDHKQTLGYSVLVVTEDDFGSLTGQAPNHRAEKIRQWLINNYAFHGIEYVLLIGDPTPYENGEGDIPMKMCWPRLGSGSYEEAPTDAFFSDLTGNWDLDGDGYYGEWSDYSGSGGVDLSPEVWVGRIPVYGTDYSYLDAILQKTIDYETEFPSGWRGNVLLPMSFSAPGYDGAPLTEQMKDDYLADRGYSWWRQYQQGSGACSADSAYPSEEELRGGTVVRDRWAAEDYGIVCWWAHGSATSVSVGYDGCWDGTLFNSTQTASLYDDHPSFTYQCSCLNGYPENTNNLQYAILKRGGVGTVSATRVSWFNTGVGYGDFDGSSTNSGIGYEYVERLTQEWAAGRALYEAKLAVLPDVLGNTRLMNQYDFNLYGDPSVQFIVEADDRYEENDTLETAWYPGSNWEKTWLSDIDFLGVQADDDWYRIEITEGYERVLVDCRFAHADGDIDIAIHDSSGVAVAWSTSVTNDEFIDCTVPSGGTYYIRVYHANAGNTYDLRWDDVTVPLGDVHLDWVNCKVRGPDRVGNYTVTGTIAVENQGTHPSPKGALKVYVSEEQVLEEGIPDMKMLPIPDIAAGNAIKRKFSAKAALPTYCPDLYFTAVVEAEGKISDPAVEVQSGGVDLTAHWLDLTKVGPDRRGRYRVKGTFLVSNTGALPSGGFEVQVFYSDDVSWEDGIDEPILRRPKRIAKLIPGAAKMGRFIYRPYGDPSDGYFLLVVDGDNAILETDETTNNVKVMASP